MFSLSSKLNLNHWAGISKRFSPHLYDSLHTTALLCSLGINIYFGFFAITFGPFFTLFTLSLSYFPSFSLGCRVDVRTFSVVCFFSHSLFCFVYKKELYTPHIERTHGKKKKYEIKEQQGKKTATRAIQKCNDYIEAMWSERE